MTMLPNSPEVKEVVLGKNGVLEGAKSGSILVGYEFDCTACVTGNFGQSKRARSYYCWTLP